jgi:hypothetical protein
VADEAMLNNVHEEKNRKFNLLHRNIVTIIIQLIITAIFDKSCKLLYVHNSFGDFYIKGIFQPFELGGETILIRSAVKH